MTNLLSAIVTAYCHCSACCGTSGNPTASGKMPVVGRTIAAPRAIALGAKIVIDGHTYIVEDRTAKRFDGRFDIFMRSHKEALKWGKQTRTITIITPIFIFGAPKEHH